MANWSRLQEQLTGLPVAKRAKYGIHFQKDNVYVQLGTISNFKELEKYAQLLEKRIHY